MDTFNRFDVVLVLFPFSDRRGIKQRPALVLSDANFNSAHRHAVVAMITTASNTKWPSDLNIAEYRAAGLVSPSVVRMKLFTIERERSIGRVGMLTAADQRSVREAMRSLVPT